MPTRLAGLDAVWLYLETRTQHMHVASVIVVDPSTSPDGVLDRGRMAGYMGQRLHLAKPFRRRLVQVPLRLDHPQWVEDPDFDLDFHVRRAALPRPGGLAELAEFASDVMSRPLDRTRPLWEMHVVEGLADGRVAIVTKTHHAAVDGVSGAELTAAILQLQPDAPPPEDPGTWEPERPPGELALLAGAGWRLVGTPLRVARTLGRTAGTAVTLARRALGGPGGDGERLDAPPSPFTAPTLPWNKAVSAHRKVGLTQVSLDATKKTKNVLGGTVNDVVLAAVAGGLRSYLAQRDALPGRPVVAMVPVSTHGAGGSPEGNAVSMMLVGLPVDVADPVARLRRVSGGTKGAKEQHGAMGAGTIQQLAELTPAGVATLASRLYSRTRAADAHRPIWNLVVSNVPGPRVPLYCAGARVEALYPLGPVHDMNGLNVTLFSYADQIYVGIDADRGLVDDVDGLGRAIVDAADELAKLARDGVAEDQEDR